jgi:hypothetical protein
VEQRHRHVADIVGAQPEALRHRHSGDRDLAVAAPHRLGVTAGARRVDEHEQVAGVRVAHDQRRIGERCHLRCPRVGIDIDVLDVANDLR